MHLKSLTHAELFLLAFDPEKLDKEALLVPDILPTFSLAGFAAKGAVVEPSGQMHPGLLALVELQNGSDPPQLCGRNREFLCHHPLQLEQLLRHGRD